MSRRSVDAGSVLLAAAFAALGIGYLGWVWVDDLTELGGDSAMYMLMAHQLSPFHQASAVFAQAVQGSAYPPLFPLLIALGGGGMLAGHLVVALSLLGALLLLHRWLRDEGFGRFQAAALTGAFALMPGTYLLSLSIWSENPCLLLSLAAIAAVHRAERRPDQTWLPWLAAAAVALATLTRVAALPLLGAFALHLLLRRPKRWPPLLAAAALPFVAWAVLSHTHQSGFSQYLAQFSDAYGGISAIAGRTAMEALRLNDAWQQAWIGKTVSGGALHGPVGVLGLLCLAGCLWRLRRLRFDAVYVVLYAALLLAWPYPAEAERLGYAVVPVLLVQGLMLIRAISSLLCDRRQLLGWAWLAATTLLLLPALLTSWQFYRQPVPDGLGLLKHTQEWYGDDRLKAVPAALVTVINLGELRMVGDAVPEGDCIFAIKPSVVTLYSERGSRTPPTTLDENTFERELLRCRYAYPMALVSPSYPDPYYPLRRIIGHGRVLSAAEGGDSDHWDTYGLLVDLRP